MTLVKFKNRPTLFDPFLDDFFRGPEWTGRERVATKRTPVNVSENEGGWNIEILAPGWTKADFEIQMEKGQLKVSVENRETSNDNYKIQQFNITGFSKSFNMPESANTEGIKAKYESGILMIEVPKKEQEIEPAPSKISVE